ncbi:lipid A deacylase LpxR family protein [Oleomonas cavernae]|nr:lipid A deacylase LpxR family protein [Oleomonas cavernae]
MIAVRAVGNGMFLSSSAAALLVAAFATAAADTARAQADAPDLQAAVLASLTVPAQAPAQVTATAGEDPTDDRGTLSLQWENDQFGGNTDQHYTNGLRASYLLSSHDTPVAVVEIARGLPFFPEEGDVRLGFSIGQSIFTPHHGEVWRHVNKGRPFAGWLYGGVQLTNDTGKQLDGFEIQLGVVGPSAGAEAVQDFYHDTTGSNRFRGWDYQLSDELGVVVAYERKWRLMAERAPGDLGIAFEPSVGAAIGNVFTYAAVGGMLKVGSDVSSDWGPPRVRPALSGTGAFKPVDDFEWYVFAGVEGRAVARNIFLDGNTFSDSQHVDKKTLVADFQAGAVVTIGKVRLTYTQVYRTEEYVGQKKRDLFGVLSASFRL